MLQSTQTADFVVCCDCELDFVKLWQVNLKFKGKIALKFAKLLTKFNRKTLLFKGFLSF